MNIFHLHFKDLGFLYTILLLLISSGCGEQHDRLADKSFFTDQPCAAPCWYGIQVDISTKEEVYRIIRRLLFVDQDSIVERSIKWIDNRKATEINFNCSHPEGKYCGSIILSEEPSTVRQIFLPVNYYLSLETLVEKFDPPSCVVYSEHNAERGGCRVEFAYPLLGIAAQYGDVNNEKLCNELAEGKGINSNIPIYSFIFSSPNPDYLSESVCTDKGAIIWPGFTEK